MGQAESTSCNARNCRQCSTSDQTTDTVKIDMATLGKFADENASPNTAHVQDPEKEKRARVQAERRAENERRELEERQRRELDQARIERRLEEEKLRRAEGELRQRAYKEAQKRSALKPEEDRRAAEEAAQRQSEAAQSEREEEERRRQEALEQEARREEVERQEIERRAKEESDKRTVENFLDANGFADVNYRRSRRMKKCYPLHEAVQQNNVTIVQCLLDARANASSKSSSNQTPLQLAQFKHAGGKLDATILQVLEAAR